MYLWRISNYADLSGRGGLMVSGRWHDRGHPCLYCSDHPATALLEILVHVDAEDLPSHYQLLKIFCPDEVSIVAAGVDGVELDELEKTRAHGSHFLATNQNCILSMPSAVMPVARNYLINPTSSEAGAIRIESAHRYALDRRLK
jgi:RES domain-containing protein